MPQGFKLSLSSLRFAHKYIKKTGDTDIFPTPFEYLIIGDENLKMISEDNPKKFERGAAIKCLSGKIQGGYRLVTLLDPIDTIFYTAILAQGGKKMEKSRIATSKKVVFSKRFLKNSPKNTLFNPNIGYSDFIERSLKLSQKYNFVVLSDIADFFPRLYVHHIENAIGVASNDNYADIVGNFLKGGNTSETIGALPVGTDASRFFSDITLNDLDRALLSKRIVFCRFSDDFRIFANSKEEARKSLYILEEELQRRYHLTLQNVKTKIETPSVYKNICKNGSEEHLQKISEIYKDGLSNILAGNRYEPVLYEELTPEIKKIVDSMNVKDLLNSCLKGNPNITKLQEIKGIFNLWRNISSPEAISIIFKNIEKLIPIFDTVMRYIKDVSGFLPKGAQVKLKDKLIEILISSKDFSHIPFYKVWILETLNAFKDVLTGGDLRKIVAMFDYEHDPLVRRFIILLLGESKKCSYWFSGMKNSFDHLTDWERRAFVKGFADCGLPKAAFRTFHRRAKSVLKDRDHYVLSLLK